MQFLIISQGMHRFIALNISNKFQAVVYFLTIFLFFIFRGRLMKFPNKLIYFIFFIIVFFIYGISINPINSALIDVLLLTMHGAFFYLGWNLYQEMHNEKLIKSILIDGIIISTIIGIFFLSFSGEIVSPIIGLLALSMFGMMRFGNKFSIYFWLIFLIMNLLWSFGKQTLLISAISLLIIFFNPASIKNAFKTYKKIANSSLKLVIFSLLGVSSYLLILSLNIEMASIRKTLLFFENLDLNTSFSLLLNYPELAYAVVDVSTAGRIYEVIITFNGFLESKIKMLFGEGLGAMIDLSGKNELAQLTFDFGETRAVQTLPAFIFLKFGILGCLIFLLVLYKQFKNRLLSNKLFYPYLLCLIASILAFSTLFKFHFITFFLGAMAANVFYARNQNKGTIRQTNE